MLKGNDGFQRKELKELCRWAKQDVAPDFLILSNLLIGGCIKELKRNLGVPVFVILQGDDIFLDSLPDRYKKECIKRMSALQDDIDGFLCHSSFYKSYMAQYLGIGLEKFHVVPLGIDGEFFEPKSTEENEHSPFTTGYLARIAPEKGLDQLIDAFVSIGKNQAREEGTGSGPMRLKVAGWLGDHRKQWLEEQWSKIDAAGLEGLAEFCGTVDDLQKKQFLESISVLCVPVNYPEPKGIYVLEAMAAGVPVVLPSVGAFPEIVEHTGGGILYDPTNPGELESALIRLQEDPEFCKELGRNGRNAIANKRSIGAMADHVIKVLSGTGV